MSVSLVDSPVSVKRFVLNLCGSRPQEPTLSGRDRQAGQQGSGDSHLLGAHDHEAGFAFVRQHRLDIEGAALEYQAVRGEVGAIAHGYAMADRVLHLGGGEVFLSLEGFDPRPDRDQVSPGFLPAARSISDGREGLDGHPVTIWSGWHLHHSGNPPRVQQAVKKVAWERRAILFLWKVLVITVK